MPITPNEIPSISPRDEVIFEIQMIIDAAASSSDNIEPYELASQIVEAIEANVNSVDGDGTVIYRV